MCRIPGPEVFVDLKTNPKFTRNELYQLHLQFGGFMHRFCHILFIFRHFCWIWETIFRYKRHMPKYSLLSHHQTISVLCFKTHLQKNHGLRFYCWFLLVVNHPNRRKPWVFARFYQQTLVVSTPAAAPRPRWRRPRDALQRCGARLWDSGQVAGGLGATAGTGKDGGGVTKPSNGVMICNVMSTSDL